MEVHKTYFSPYVAALSHNVAQLLPGDLDMSFFPNSGAEAVEGAVKAAYKYHGGNRRTILHADIAFHGRPLGSNSLTGGADMFRFPEIPGAVTFPYGDLAVSQLCDARMFGYVARRRGALFTCYFAAVRTVVKVVIAAAAVAGVAQWPASVRFRAIYQKLLVTADFIGSSMT